VLVCIDDADRLNGGSLQVLDTFLGEAPLSGVKMLLTSEQEPRIEHPDKVAARRLCGLSRIDAQRVLQTVAGPSGRPPRLPRDDDDIEPLYIEQLLALHADGEPTRDVASLSSAIDARVQGLLPDQRRLLQAVAVTGGGPETEIAAVLAEEVSTSATLASEHLLTVESGALRIPHRTIADRVLADIPAGTLATLHARAAETISQRPSDIEVRALHAVRGQPDFEAFLLVEEAARLRTTRGDDDGAILMLLEGFEAARSQGMRSELAAASAEAVFTRKLGTALLNARRFEEAIHFLQKTLEKPDDRLAERALILEQLAIALTGCGRGDEAARRRKEAHALAEKIGDRTLLQRFKAERQESQTRRRTNGLYRTPYTTNAPSLGALSGGKPTGHGAPIENGEPPTRVRSSEKRATPKNADPRSEETDATAPIVDVVDVGQPRRKR
jgi:hypothetical protein